MSGEEQGRGKLVFPPVSATCVDRSVLGQPGVTIDMLPDDVLLEIFDFYKWVRQLGTILLVSCRYVPCQWRWQNLAHVCRRWRHIILASPRRLDLRVFCIPSTPTRNLPNIWPSFPISINAHFRIFSWSAEAEENIIAALGQRDHISEISLSGLTGPMMERFAAVMEEPLPALTYLALSVIDMMKMSLPEGFLGGSAPRLRSITLHNTPFPALPNLLLSASNLQYLCLQYIPVTGYISPHAMVNVLPALPNLESLTIRFQFIFRDRPDRPVHITAPPLTRAVLPALTNFVFDGTSEYLEDFLARIDPPLLNILHMTLSLRFDIPQVYKLIDRTERFKKLNQAEMKLCRWGAWTAFGSSTGSPHAPELRVNPTVIGRSLQVPSILPLLSQVLSQVERLHVVEELKNESKWQDRDHTEWLELLDPFFSVKSLYVDERLGPSVAHVLQELAGERVMEVLPALHDLFLEGLQPSGSVQEALKPFLAARQCSNHPVVIQRWDRMPKVKTGLERLLSGPR
jgi:hypothetical protein